MILYESKTSGIHRVLGTSGFLYRSNKLMYDLKTQSLWSTLEGRPVVGPLVGKGIALKRRSVVTTTWGAWRKRHPKTKVLSLETGYRRNYDEGVAYQNYFSNDRLMFNTKFSDRRLKNKAEVLGLRLGTSPEKALAIPASWLVKNPIYHGKLGNREFVVLTDNSGSIRVYEGGAIEFVKWDAQSSLVDGKGNKWTLSESELSCKGEATRKRWPQHRAFWFGWVAAFPATELILEATKKKPKTFVPEVKVEGTDARG